MADNQATGGEPKRPVPPPETPGQLAWRYVAWALAISAFMYYYWSSSLETGKHQTVAYSEFKNKVREDAVLKVTLQGERITGVYRSGALKTEKTPARTGAPATFNTTLPPVDDPDLIPLLEKHHVEIDTKPKEASWWLQALVAFLPWIFIIAVFYFASRKLSERFSQGGTLFGFSKSKARHHESHLRRCCRPGQCQDGFA